MTLVTSAEQVAGQLEYSRTADSTRERFMKMGVETIVATAVTRWHGTTATLMNLYTGDVEERVFDSLVLATTNQPENRLSIGLEKLPREIHTIGDATSPRTASMAIYEARKLAMRL